MWEVITEHDGTSGPTALSVMYFDDGSDIAAVRAEVGDFWAGVNDITANGTIRTVRTEGRIIDSATGTLTGFWSEPTPETITGTASGSSVPDSSQALVRWITPGIVRGRRVQGRTFIPFLSLAQVAGGNLAGAAKAAITLAAANLTGVPPGMVIWSRPTASAPGEESSVTQATVWDEFAVLRRRRG